MSRVTPYDFALPRPGQGRVRVVEIDYQRNGVFGHGFFTLRILSRDSITAKRARRRTSAARSIPRLRLSILRI
jgi:hypothetical protein